MLLRAILIKHVPNAGVDAFVYQAAMACECVTPWVRGVFSRCSFSLLGVVWVGEPTGCRIMRSESEESAPAREPHVVYSCQPPFLSHTTGFDVPH